jgi:hypothetical protein
VVGPLRRSLPRRGASLVAGVVVAAVVGLAVAPAGALPVDALVSRPDLRPPPVTIRTHVAGAAPGFLLLGPKRRAKSSVVAQQGAMVADDLGRVRWFSPGTRPATDVRVQSYAGQPVLTYWRGGIDSGHGTGTGTGTILNASYRPVARVHAARGCQVDLHEFRLTPQGTALILCYRQGRRDLRSVGGPRSAPTLDCVLQEIDVASGRLRFQWSGLDHIALSESHESPTRLSSRRTYDPLHFNSVVKDADGNYLISARHTWAVYKVGGSTGRILWRLGGKRSDFRVSAGARTAWQHDAEFETPDRVRIFDNGAGTGGQAPLRRRSRVVTLALDPARKLATVVRSLHHPSGLSAGSQGNGQLLGGGDTFVGWGATGAFSELTPAGRLVLDGRLPDGFDTYRAYRDAWVGAPGRPPAVAARRASGETAAYASWNGDTRVSSWQVLSGPSGGALTPTGKPVPWSGLETRIPVAGRPAFLAVRALDAAGTPLADSGAVAPSY